MPARTTRRRIDPLPPPAQPHITASGFGLPGVNGRYNLVTPPGFYVQYTHTENTFTLWWDGFNTWTINDTAIIAGGTNEYQRTPEPTGNPRGSYTVTGGVAPGGTVA